MILYEITAKDPEQEMHASIKDIMSQLFDGKITKDTALLLLDDLVNDFNARKFYMDDSEKDKDIFLSLPLILRIARSVINKHI